MAEVEIKFEHKYVSLPSFVRDDVRSSWEGETVHKVGDLPNSSYIHHYAFSLMIDFIEKYLDNVKKSGADSDLTRAEIIKWLSTTNSKN